MPTLTSRANVAYSRGDLKLALDLSERGLALPVDELPPRDAHELWVLRSHCLNAQGRWPEALAALESAGHVGELDTATAARLAMHKGYLVGLMARYAECWSLLNQAEKIARKNGLTLLLAEVLWRRGMISIFAGEHATAESCLNSALGLASQESNRELQGLVTAGLGKSVMFRGRYADAIPYFEKALAIFKELQDRFYAAIIWSELANCYLHLDGPEKALDLFEQAERVFLDSGAVPNYQVCLANIGNVYLYRQDFLTAISYYQRALELARQLDDWVSIAKWLRNLGQAYSCLGSPEVARRFESEADVLGRNLAQERERAVQIAASPK